MNQHSRLLLNQHSSTPLFQPSFHSCSLLTPLYLHTPLTLLLYLPLLTPLHPHHSTYLIPLYLANLTLPPNSTLLPSTHSSPPTPTPLYSLTPLPEPRLSDIDWFVFLSNYRYHGKVSTWRPSQLLPDHVTRVISFFLWPVNHIQVCRVII